MPRQIGIRSLSVLVTEKGLAPFVLKLIVLCGYRTLLYVNGYRLPMIVVKKH